MLLFEHLNVVRFGDTFSISCGVYEVLSFYREDIASLYLDA